MTKELFLDKRTYSEYSTAYVFLFVLLFLCLKIIICLTLYRYGLSYFNLYKYTVVFPFHENSVYPKW